MRLAFAVLLLVSVGNAKPKAAPEWMASWTDALTEGRALNLPIVVHRHGFY